MVPPLPILGATLLFLVPCMVSDFRTMRIPNRLTGPAMLAGIALNVVYGGWGGASASFGGALLVTVLLFGPFALGGVGAGDVKMMTAVGALLGPRLALYSLIVGVALGGVFAVVQLARMARLREKLGALKDMALDTMLTRSIAPLKLSATDPNAVALPYSLPLGIGTASVIAISMALKP